MGDHPTVKTEKGISPYVTVELVHQDVEHRLILHVLNYDHARNSHLTDIQVDVTIPGNKQVKRMQILTPDEPRRTLSLHWSGEQPVRFTIPSVEIYSIVVLDLE
jgi:hypothetical protein